MTNQIKKIWNIASTVLVVVVALAAVLLVGVRLFGLQVFTVLSGSMEPEYPVGSLIYVKKVDYKTLKPGDVITYMLDEDTVSTHRITEVLIDEEDPNIYRYFTKGDVNKDPDSVSVHCANIIGTPVLTIPMLGYVANYIQNPPGTYIALAAGAILILLVFLPDLFREEEKKPAAPSDEEAPNSESI